ncbi:GNAT family N-acetyltransferase [Caldilinea sp.]|uniref:GNAT family N-acetyltransferase n=1 Tax=Caldilinea sp. TaxID=2293560 RepID=UPI002B792B29|nr:GNAT family N-acetyltransferase [Anaerolineales bacterium]HQY90072.1 GNAT family N-acetyltransferase [Caldilinea sp.]
MHQSTHDSVDYRIHPPVDNAALNTLFAAAWPGHTPVDFTAQLTHSLLYVCAYTAQTDLIGFVNVAWDGGIHAFLLDTTVHPAWQRRGVGRELVQRATVAARRRGIDWLHVDYEPGLDAFYRACGFTPTLAGLIRLNGSA